MSNKGHLRWRCRRGMRELDKAMLGYLDNYYDEASATERADFESLLDWQEPELYRLVCGKDKDAHYQHIIDKIAVSLAGNSPTV